MPINKNNNEILINDTNLNIRFIILIEFKKNKITFNIKRILLL